MTLTEPIDRSIARAAARHYGNIARRKLLDLGLSSSAIDRRLSCGRLHLVFAGVYSVGRPPVTPLELASAAVLACGPGAALSHGSAMTLWGFWQRWEKPFEVTLPHGDRRPARIRVHRSRTLRPRDITTHLGIRVTRPARALLDIAPRLTDRALARAVDDALRSRYLRRSHLAEQLLRNPNHPATRRLIQFVTTRDGPSRSDWERAFPAFCEAYDLPRPLLNTKVAGHEVDAVWPAEKLIVELDSWEFHSSRTAFERNRDRDADTLARGYGTVRITWERMISSAPKEAARLHQILHARRLRAA